jgi:glycosyltransferase involved in cell wall biosynthesis
MGIRKAKILIIDSGQFGYNTDLFFYAKYLSETFDVTVLTFDRGKKVITSDRFPVITLKYRGLFSAPFHLVFNTRPLYKTHKFDFIFVSYFAGCSLLHLIISGEKMLVDIRSSFIMKGRPFIEYIYNKLMRFEFRMFQNRSMVSQGLADYMNIRKAVTVFPLGGEPMRDTVKPKSFTQLNLLYIGTFNDRNIAMTIRGLSMFLQRNQTGIAIHYTIIGFGTNQEVSSIVETIRETGLEKVVSYHGELRYPDTLPFLENNNVGVSFVPITPYYDCQPPTKTFEYLMYGLPVIATDTLENRKILTWSNGILTDDSEEGFSIGLEMMTERLSQYNSMQIREEIRKHSWSNIVNSVVRPYIEKKISAARE